MNISAIAQQVKETHSAMLVRPRIDKQARKYVRDSAGNIQYDMKELFTGNKRGWVVFDAVTANAFCTVREALNDENKPKFDRIPLPTLLDFVWKSVK